MRMTLNSCQFHEAWGILWDDWSKQCWHIHQTWSIRSFRFKSLIMMYFAFILEHFMWCFSPPSNFIHCFMRWYRWMAWRGLPTTNSFTRHSVSWAHLPNLLPCATACDPVKKKKKESLNENLRSERQRLNCLSRYHSSVTESWVRFQTKIQSPASLQQRRSLSSFGCFTQSFSFEIPSFCKDQ